MLQSNKRLYSGHKDNILVEIQKLILVNEQYFNKQIIKELNKFNIK